MFSNRIFFFSFWQAGCSEVWKCRLFPSQSHTLTREHASRTPHSAAVTEEGEHAASLWISVQLSCWPAGGSIMQCSTLIPGWLQVMLIIYCQHPTTTVTTQLFTLNNECFWSFSICGCNTFFFSVVDSPKLELCLLCMENVLSGQTCGVHSSACQHSCRRGILWLHSFLQENVRWVTVVSAVSSICKSVLRFNLSTLSPWCGSAAWIQNHPLKRWCSFLTWPSWEKKRIWAITLTLSRNSTGTHRVIFLQQDTIGKLFSEKSSCFIITSVIVQCHFGFHGQIVQVGAFRDIWKVKRRSYSISLQNHTNHPIVQFCKEKKKIQVRSCLFPPPKVTKGYDENSILFIKRGT